MLRKYAALLRRSMGAMFEYRAAIFIWMLTNVMPLVMLAVWFSLAEDGPIAGYTQDDFVAYYLLLTVVRQMTSVWVIWELDYEIRHGALAIKLLHPIDPIHEYIAGHLTDKVLRVVVLIPLGLLAWWIFPTIHYDLTPLNFLLMLIATVIAWLIRFLSQYCFGLLAFWISESITLNDVWFAMTMMLGGIVAPLDLFPANVRDVANYLPFRFMLAFPVEIVSGRLTPAELVTGFATMTFWLIVIVIVYRWLWRKGIRQFSAFGA
ncbi:MAG: ABC-2 family transporter protein [Chloroflexi bacterium]|nr:ABC-2 family transporter protein [Chloroflexota bacterium]